MMTTEPKQIVRQFITEVWNARNLDNLNDLVVKANTVVPSDEPFTYQGRDAVLQMLQDFHITYPDKQLKIGRQWVEGNTVATHLSYVPEKGQRTSGFPSDFVLWVRLEDDKIAAAEMTPRMSELSKPGALFMYTCLSLSRTEHVRRIATIGGQLALAALLVVGSWLLVTRLADFAEEKLQEWLPADETLLQKDLRLEQPIALNRQTSSDGNRVVFVTDRQLDPVDTNSFLDVYVHDFRTKANVLVSRGFVTRTQTVEGDNSTVVTESVAASGWSIDPLLSADGNKVLFLSYATNLVAEQNVPLPSHFEFDLNTESMQVVRTFEDTTFNLPIDALWWVSSSRFERARILQQHETARMMALKHLRLVKDFFRYHFAYLLGAFLMTLISVVALISIVRVGWSNAHPYIIALFTTATAIGIALTTISNIFSFGDNLSNNTQAYVKYANLANLIRSYVGTSQVINATTGMDQSVEPTTFILFVDREMAEAFSLPVRLNAEAVPSRDDLLVLFDIPIPGGSETVGGAGQSASVSSDEVQEDRAPSPNGGPSDIAPTPTHTPTARPTRTTVGATVAPTPTPTHTPVPTETPLPAQTATVSPTSTP